MTISQFPHCDQRILHAKGECEFCDRHPDWQELRKAWGIAFTGYTPAGVLPECGETYRIQGRAETCRQPQGHTGDHLPYPDWCILPCPADFARPPDAGNDHRKWPGNRPEGY